MTPDQSPPPTNDGVPMTSDQALPPNYGAPNPQYPSPPLQPGMPGPLYLEPPLSPMALSSLIFGIVGLVGLPLIGSIVAVVLGHLSRNEIRRSQGQIRGDGLALAGLILGYIGIALIVILGIVIVFGFVFAFSTSSSTSR